MEFKISYDEEIRNIPSFVERHTSDLIKLMKLEYHRSILGSIPTEIKESIRQELKKMKNNALLIELLGTDTDVIYRMRDRIEHEVGMIDEKDLDTSITRQMELEEEKAYMDHQAEQYKDEIREQTLQQKLEKKEKKRRLENVTDVLENKVELVETLQQSQSSSRINQFLEDQKHVTEAILEYARKESTKL